MSTQIGNRIGGELVARARTIARHTGVAWSTSMLQVRVGDEGTGSPGLLHQMPNLKVDTPRVVTLNDEACVRQGLEFVLVRRADFLPD